MLSVKKSSLIFIMRYYTYEKNNTLFLKDIVKAFEYIQNFVEGMTFEEFLRDEKTSSAVIRKFEIIGEAVKNLPEFIRNKYPDIMWKDTPV